MAFSDDFTFTRGTGKTRINRAGLIVGVDFSSTSITFGTGSRAFTLAANANVNRDWVIGSKVVAVSQAAPLGSLEGTVVSYVPSTQVLTINVTVSTGTGTSTNWRIGSLEATREPSSNSLESHAAATNLFTFSNEFENAVWIKSNGAITTNVAIGTGGSSTADRFVPDATLNIHSLRRAHSFVAEEIYSSTWLVKAEGYSSFKINLPSAAFGVNNAADFNLLNKTTTLSSGEPIDFGLIELGNSWFIAYITARATITASAQAFVSIISGGTETFTGDGVSGMLFDGGQLHIGSYVPFIPTTTVQVSCAADTVALSASAIARLGSEGTLYAEVLTEDKGPVQKRMMRLSGINSDVRIAKRGIGSFAGFTKQQEVDDVLYVGTSAGFSQRDNGREFSSITAAVNERTGLPETVGAVQAFSYDGLNNIGYVTSVEERFLTKDLSLWSGKGVGTAELRRGVQIGSRFVISSTITGSMIIYNGLNYRRVNTPILTQPTRSVASNGSRLVTVGDNGFIAYSDDQGETWITASINNAGTTVNLSSVIFAAGLFVATRAANQAGQNIITSPDGITWTARTKAGGTSDVAYNGTNLFVACGIGGTIYTSPDAITWTIQTSNTANALNGVHFTNALWVAVGVNGTIITSPNGTTWTVRTSGTTQNLNDVASINDLFVAVGNAQTVITSLNGTTWSPRTVNISGILLGVNLLGSNIIVTGAGGGISTSADGITYTSMTNNSAVIEDICYGSDSYYAAGAAQGGSGYIARISSIGEVARQSAVPNQSYFSSKFLRGTFFFTGTASSIFKISSLGVKEAITVGGTAFTIRDITDSGSLFVAVGTAGRFTTSVDGNTFTASALLGIGNVQMNGVLFANGLYVTVGNSGNILTSLNGTTWTSRVSGTTKNLSSVMYSLRDNLWYVAGASGTLLYSPDAINWQPVQNSGFGSVTSSTLQSAQILPQFRVGRNKIGISYKDGRVITSLNGVSTIDVTASVPSVITSGAIAENLNGFIKTAKIYPEAISAEELNAITGL